MKFGAVVFPTSNCDQALVDAISLGMRQECVKLWRKDHDLQRCDFILLPGALLRNTNQRFICDNVYIRPVTTNLLPTRNLDLNKAYKIPVAHGEGRYHADKETLRKLEDNGQIMFKYSNNIADTHDIYNINGSLPNIAGVSNEQKNVFGMMPHPERALDPELGNTDGRAIFESILNLVNA